MLFLKSCYIPIGPMCPIGGIGPYGPIGMGGMPIGTGGIGPGGGGILGTGGGIPGGGPTELVAAPVFSSSNSLPPTPSAQYRTNYSGIVYHVHFRLLKIYWINYIVILCTYTANLVINVEPIKVWKITEYSVDNYASENIIEIINIIYPRKLNNSIILLKSQGKLVSLLYCT